MNDSIKQLLLSKVEQIERDLAEVKLLLQEEMPVSIPKKEENISVQNQQPKEVLSTLFSLVKQDLTEEELPSQLAVLLHSSISEHSKALDNFIRFSFKTFKVRWKDYLQDPNDPSSFQINRQQENNRGELSELRLYLHVHHRSPTPISLKQDPQAGLSWKIFALSL